MNFPLGDTEVAVFQFIEILSLISALSVTFVLFLILFLKNKEKNRKLEEQNKTASLLTKTITQVQESERSRISQDLHDTVTQDIRTALLFVHKLKELSDFKNSSEKTKSLILRIQEIEEENLRTIRNIIRNLTPPEIESANFISLLSEYCENTSLASGIQCKFYSEQTEFIKRLSTEQKIHIFRIIQESVNNAVKHSEADEISVIVRNEEREDKSGLVFYISDDGKGIQETSDANPEESTERSLLEESTHLGLKGIKSRSLLLNADLSIKSDSETGTHVRLFLPIQ